jgi:hypothetical protein
MTVERSLGRFAVFRATYELLRKGWGNISRIGESLRFHIHDRGHLIRHLQIWRSDSSVVLGGSVLRHKL